MNCIRTLPYIKAWHSRYADKGLTVIGVHSPEFLFARYESNVERGIEEFGLTYPIVVDSNMELWQAFANRYWPTKYLIDANGYLRSLTSAKAPTVRPKKTFRNCCEKSILISPCLRCSAHCATPTVPAPCAISHHRNSTLDTAAGALAMRVNSWKTSPLTTHIRANSRRLLLRPWPLDCHRRPS